MFSVLAYECTVCLLFIIRKSIAIERIQVILVFYRSISHRLGDSCSSEHEYSFFSDVFGAILGAPKMMHPSPSVRRENLQPLTKDAHMSPPIKGQCPVTNSSPKSASCACWEWRWLVVLVVSLTIDVNHKTSWWFSHIFMFTPKIGGRYFHPF